MEQNLSNSRKNGKNNNKMKQNRHSFLFITFHIQSFPISVIRQKHYKTKRKKIEIQGISVYNFAIIKDLSRPN